MKIDIAGVNVDPVTKSQALEKIDGLIKSGKPSLVVTTYSEFIVFAYRHPEYKKVLNSADLSLADGFGILWASKYLSVAGGFLKLISTLLRALVDKKYFKTVIPEVITGSRLIWDIARLAEGRGYSLALVGGGDSVAPQAAYELKKQFPNLKVNLAVSGAAAFDEKTIMEIARSNSDILLIAYSPPKQETWLWENLSKLNVKLAMGLGGTFDYIAGKRLASPNFMHYMGLEWLWRLITQPWRIRRIWNAVPVFIWTVFKYKISKR